jgi:hypothetical protein
MRPIIVKGIQGFLISRKEMVEKAVAEDRQSLHEQDAYSTIRELFESSVEDARRLCARDRFTRRF